MFKEEKEFEYSEYLLETKVFMQYIVGSLASEFLGWSWKTHVGIPMLDIGIPM